MSDTTVLMSVIVFYLVKQNTYHVVLGILLFVKT